MQGYCIQISRLPHERVQLYYANMQRMSLLPILVLLLGFIPAQTLATTTSYGSPYYSFSYPSQYQLKEYKDREGGVFGQTIFNGKMGLPEDVLQIQTVETDTEGHMTESTAIALARRACDADGPQTSIRCTGVTLLSPVHTKELQGFRLLLQEETRNLATGKVSSRIRGPVYVLSERVTQGTVMISYNSSTRPQRIHLRLLQQILRTFVGD